MENNELDMRIKDIEARNSRVEKSKAWETSWLRRISIAVLTYITIVIYHLLIGAENVYIISLVPVIGFILSTLSLSFIRKKFENED